MWTCTLFLQAPVYIEGFLSAHNECLGVLLLDNHGISVPTRFLQKAGVDVALHLAKRLSTLRLEDATASVQKDKDMPLSLTRKLVENSGKFMEFPGLFGYLWLMNQKRRSVEQLLSTFLRDDTSWAIGRRKRQCSWGLTAWCLKCRVDLKPWIAMWRATSLRQPDFKRWRSNVAMINRQFHQPHTVALYKKCATHSSIVHLVYNYQLYTSIIQELTHPPAVPGKRVWVRVGWQ